MKVLLFTVAKIGAKIAKNDIDVTETQRNLITMINAISRCKNLQRARLSKLFGRMKAYYKR